jgi:hypothetical protein
VSWTSPDCGLGRLYGLTVLNLTLLLILLVLGRNLICALMERRGVLGARSSAPALVFPLAASRPACRWWWWAATSSSRPSTGGSS